MESPRNCEDGKEETLNLAIGPFEVSVCHQPGSTVTWPGDVDGVQVVLFDDPVQVNVYKVQAWCRAPVSEQTRLDMLQRQRLLEQRIVIEIDLADGQIVGCPPVGIQLAE